MPRRAARDHELELLWRLRFGEPPPIVADAETTRRVLRAYGHAPAPRLCVEAAALESEAGRACAELRAVREQSRRLLAEARVLAGVRAGAAA